MGDLTLRRILGLALAVVIVIAIWSAGWFAIANVVRGQVEMLAEADGETAPRLTCGEHGVAGFPFRFDVECREATLVSLDMSYAIPALRLSVLVYNPTHAIFSAQSPVLAEDAFSGSRQRIDFAGFEGSARFVARDFFAGVTEGRGWRIGRISLVAEGLAVTDTTATEELRLSAARAEAHLLDAPEQHDPAAGTATLAGYVRAEGLDVPLLDVADATASLEAEATRVPDDLLLLAESAEPLRDWQQRGGQFRLYRLAGEQEQPAESFEIAGTARLSDTGLITAEIDYKTRGVLDRLAGLVQPLQLAALRGKPEADGSFTNSMQMVNGELKLLTFTLAEIPPLW